MAIRLIATDLDGTLLNEEKQVSEENRVAVEAAVKKGVMVTIATGRMYCSALPYAKQLGIDVPIITYNGALIRSVSGETWLERPLQREPAAEALSFIRGRGWHTHSFIGDRLYYQARNEKTDVYEKGAGISGEAIGGELFLRTEGILKLLLVMDGEIQADAAVDELNRRFAGRLTAVKSSPTYVEIIQFEVSKAAALETLMDRFGLKKSEVMAIGDSNNDLPMLRAAGFAVAMGNANPAVKKAADAVTESNRKSGVAAAIQNYILNEKG